jgi:hypothetical protein
MEEKKTNMQQAIFVYGMANIGCDQRNATFQTLVQGGERQDMKEDATEEAKPSPKTGGGRPKKSGGFIRQAFIYESELVRVGMFYQGLLALGWIDAKTDQHDFIELFSGGEVSQRVIWKGDANTLAELFKRLVKERQLVKLPDGLTLWVMVCGHFWNQKRGEEFETGNLRMTHAPKENDKPIGYLVKILDPEVPMQEVRRMMQSQR